MAQTQFMSLISIASCVLVALVANFIISSKSSPYLFCISDPAAQSITTLDSSLPKAQCFRVKDGIFTETLAAVPEATSEEITYHDGFVLPGFVDSHGHILQYGEMLESVSLYGAESMEEVRSRIKDYLKKHEGEGYGTRDKWIRGIGWDQKYFNGVMPTAAELAKDPALADLYIMLDRVDVHCVLTSEKVLQLLPIPLPESPPGGVIITDPGLGVFCDNAIDSIIFPVAPLPTPAQKTHWFESAMASLNSVGIVGIGDAGMRAEDVSILQNLADTGEMTVRVNVMLECNTRNTFCPTEVQELQIVQHIATNLQSTSLLTLGGVKLFADGALGSWGAAMLEPYSDNPTTSGTMLINETALTSIVQQWYSAGFQVNIHAIGDRANRAAISAFNTVLGPNCNNCNANPANRLRIEHAQIIHPEDQHLMKLLGIIPSIQPTHATSDMAYALSRLGSERLSSSAYRMRSLYPATSSLASGDYPGPVLGSDFPVEPPSPLQGMYAAVTRLNPATGDSPDGERGWFKEEEGLSIDQALRGFTSNAGWGWKRESKMGVIREGAWADWIVVDRDLMAEDMADGKGLKDVVVKETWVGGRKVYPLGGMEDVKASAAFAAGWIKTFAKWQTKVVSWILSIAT